MGQWPTANTGYGFPIESSTIWTYMEEQGIDEDPEEFLYFLLQKKFPDLCYSSSGHESVCVGEGKDLVVYLKRTLQTWSWDGPKRLEHHQNTISQEELEGLFRCAEALGIEKPDLGWWGVCSFG